MNTNYLLMIRAIYTGLLTGIAIAIPMGPAGFESVRWTISKGFKQGVKVAAGSLIADAIDVILINFGLLELIEKNKLLEVSFWIISGVIIFFIGYKSLRKYKDNNAEKEEPILEEKELDSHALFTGFIVNFSNPMTHFFWLTLSSTVIRIWRSYGKLTYFIFALFMLFGMFMSLWTINYVASRGKKLTTPKVSGKLENIISYVITLFGLGFMVNGLYKLYNFLVK
ncbi:LysE family translocator [Clostridium sp.]|jgi:threonine/homoserine/homoserine lactone efflux protein|uniref:LysE family translocator n=1 Tax=Clostridium sp. TaxID=1506 RepID=UPI0039F48A9B